MFRRFTLLSGGRFFFLLQRDFVPVLVLSPLRWMMFFHCSHYLRRLLTGVEVSGGMSPCVCVCQSQNHSGWVTHPCYPADHSTTVRLSSLFDSPCTEQYRPERYEPQASVTVRGSGRYQQCLGNMSAIFSFHSCRFSRCSFDDAFQPNVSGSFMVTGGVADEPSPNPPSVTHWTFNSRLPGYCMVLRECE